MQGPAKGSEEAIQKVQLDWRRDALVKESAEIDKEIEKARQRLISWQDRKDKIAGRIVSVDRMIAELAGTSDS